MQIDQWLQAVLDAVEDAISIVNDKGLGIYINPAYTRLTGLTKEDVLGKPATVDIAEGDSVHFKVLASGKPVHNATLKVGTSKKEVVVNVAPVWIDDKVQGSVAVIHDVTDLRRLTEALQRAKAIIRKLEAKYTFEDIVAQDAMMRVIIDKAKHAADTPATVLLRGESGTGKLLFAHSIHNASSRKFNRFVRVNCAALTESLLESELFGYEEGAFTGARKGGKKGLLEEAQDGTVFLDEIGAISAEMQMKLLRFLQEKEFMRVGGTRTVSVDVRIIAATNANLERLIEVKQFREDLYYRLNVIPILIPPLRHHPQDIYPLCRHFIDKYNLEYGRNVEDIAPEVMEQLMAYEWPGNVRELENVIGRGMVYVGYKEKVLPVELLPVLLHPPMMRNLSSRNEELAPVESLSKAMEAYEKETILKVLSAYGNNRNQTAAALGISVRTLYYKMQHHVILVSNKKND